MILCKPCISNDSECKKCCSSCDEHCEEVCAIATNGLKCGNKLIKEDEE